MVHSALIGHNLSNYKPLTWTGHLKHFGSFALNKSKFNYPVLFYAIISCPEMWVVPFNKTLVYYDFLYNI